jgi:hypothetical protein
MDRGALAEACGKLERSFQLAPRLGTMLNLGSCFERRGKLARALALYERAATLARQQGRKDREAAAREYAVALEPKVAKLLIVTEEPSVDLVMQLDSEVVTARSGLVACDPGASVFSARVPGRAPFDVRLSLVAGTTTTVTVPKLKVEQASALPPPQVEGRPVRTAALVTGFALAGVGAGLGTFFGLRAKSIHDDSQRECDPSGCSANGLRLISDARTSGNVATIAFVASGAILAGTLAGLFFTSRPAARTTASQATRVRLTPNLGGASLFVVF